VPAGLSSAEAAHRRAEFGLNAGAEERVHPLKQVHAIRLQLIRVRLGIATQLARRLALLSNDGGFRTTGAFERRGSAEQSGAATAGREPTQGRSAGSRRGAPGRVQMWRLVRIRALDQ